MLLFAKRFKTNSNKLNRFSSRTRLCFTLWVMPQVYSPHVLIPQLRLKVQPHFWNIVFSWNRQHKEQKEQTNRAVLKLCLEITRVLFQLHSMDNGPAKISRVRSILLQKEPSNGQINKYLDSTIKLLF